MHWRSFASVFPCHAIFLAPRWINPALATEHRERRSALELLRMLSPKTQTNLKNAESYFKEHLAVGDYYTEANRVTGEWIGIGADALGLSGVVLEADFLKLCENVHPQKGERLTQRTKVARHSDDGSDTANRRVFFDFTFSPPKSVSIAALVAGDGRITTAHRRAVKIAVEELERFAATRVRKSLSNADRTTGNIAAALFEHETSRALDPHLHTHCIVFNATHDATENRWKAMQNYQMLAAQKYVENVYYHERARELRACGYRVENNARGDFRVAEVSSELCARFSKRHAQIDEQTREFLALHPEKVSADVQSIREHLAHKERSRKQQEVSGLHLRALWQSELQPGEQPVFKSGNQAHITPVTGAAGAVDWAEDHLFDRRSLVQEHELWRYALEFARGHRVTVDDIKRETASRPYIRGELGKLTRRDVLAREWEIVQLAKQGAYAQSSLARNEGREDGDLADDQKIALRRILSSRDLITLFRGGAGTGKSYVLRRVQEALHREGRDTHVLAPQRQQVIDLSKDGLQTAQTVAEFLAQASVRAGAVVIVDEAGQIGARQLSALLQLVTSRGGRVVLSGDTRQHGPVEASDALRAIERYSGLSAAELNEIRRQDPKRAHDEDERRKICEYRAAVKEAAGGAPEASFDRLEQAGAIVEAPSELLREELARTYVELATQKQPAIVVSQTWSEIDELNEKIRGSLRHSGLLGEAEQTIDSLRQVDLTDAQKADQRYYPSDHIVVFNRAAGKCQRGDVGRVLGITKRGVVVDTGHSLHVLNPLQLDVINVCRPVQLALSAGDRLQLKANALSREGAKLANGEIVSVAKLKRTGEIALTDGRTLPASYRQFVRGYAVTSYGSQGKTVDHVLLADSTSRAATNAQQWYVSISRGRKSVRIFTPNKAQLRRNITQTGNRPLALEMERLKRERIAIQSGNLRVLRGRALAKALCLMAARKLRIGRKHRETITV
jgi:conjugative relaxase-like TrwC/TraI family protein